MATQIEIAQRDDGRWIWRYVDGDFALDSNDDYDGPPQARAAAAIAYPDVEPKSPEPRNPRSTATGIGRFVTFVMMVIVFWRWWRRA